MQPGDNNKKASDSLSSELSNFVIFDFLPQYAIEIHRQASGTASGQENEEGAGCMIAGDSIDTGIYHYSDSGDREN